MVLEILDNSTIVLTINQLTTNWQDYPAPTILAQLGEKWVQEGKTIALKVLSCIVSSAHNYLLNCCHPDYGRVKLIERSVFRFDGRLLK